MFDVFLALRVVKFVFGISTWGSMLPEFIHISKVEHLTYKTLSTQWKELSVCPSVCMYMLTAWQNNAALV